MSRKQYPKYKPSGVPWLGEVPEGWEVKRLKFTAHVIMGQSPSSNDYSDDVEQLPFLQGNADFADRYPIPRIYCDTANKIILANSLLISVRAPVGALNESDQKYGIGRGLCAIQPIHCLVKNFAWYGIQVTREELNTLATGSTYDAVSADEVANMNFPLPPHPEQQAIAAFLDRETGRIDALIEKKNRLIALLKEKRSAMISRAVTKGLNPSVKLKPSGVPWLGDVPEGWEVKRLKTSVNYWVSNVDKVPSEDEQPILLCNYTDVYYNDFISPDLSLMETTATSEEIKKFRLEIGDVVITKDSESWEDIAVPSLVVKTEPILLCGYHLAMIRPQSKKIVGEFLFRQLQSSAINHQFQIASTGVTRYGLPKSAIGDAIVPLPPLPEQQTIAAFLDRETSKIDALVSKVETAIERLKEYRTSLISSAVTGKIDVREEVKLEAANE